MGAIVRIGEWGGSYAVRLPASVVETLQLKKGQPVEFSIHNGSLTITPKFSSPTLSELCTVAQSQKPPALAWIDDALPSEWADE